MATDFKGDMQSDGDDDASAGSLQNVGQKRRSENQVEDGKPAAQRARIEEECDESSSSPNEPVHVEGNRDTHPTSEDGERVDDSSNKPSAINLSNRSPCGECETCMEPFKCGECARCISDSRCVFSPCYNYHFQTSTLQWYQQHANSVKAANSELEAPFEKLYGENGVFTTKLGNKRKSAADDSTITTTTGSRRDQNCGALCGTCLSCTAKKRCEKCANCLEGRKRCVFAPCLKYDYSGSTLVRNRGQAKSAMMIDKSLEHQFEHLYGLGGLFASKLQKKTEPKGQPVLERISRNTRCQSCLGCTTTVTCKKCQVCRRGQTNRCIFYPCFKYDYKELTLQSWREEAASIKVGDSNLEDQFERMYGARGLFAAKNGKSTHVSGRSTNRETATSSSRSALENRCGCSPCRSPFACRVCTRCKAQKRCVFNLCQTYTYKDSTMAAYRMYARQALEASKDRKLKLRFDELFSKAKKQTTTSQLPKGTRIYARWPENNQWYYGKIVRQRYHLFDIVFDDGDKRNGVTEAEFEVVPVSERNKKERATYLNTPQEQVIDGATSTQDNDAHFLLNKGYYHQWINRDGNVKAVYGKFESCVLKDGKLGFTVTLDLSVGSLFAFGVRKEAPNPQMYDIEEADAWAGYLSFLVQTEGKSFSDPSAHLPESKPFYRHYIVPTIRSFSPQRTMRLAVKGHHVLLKAKESKIPNGGLGLFISAMPIQPTDSCSTSRNTALVLEEGELIDLGVYGPLRPEDLQPDHVLIVKYFVHDWKSESWSFDVAGDEHLVFDITDDDTGYLSKVAEDNVIVFTNETNGIERPTVFAKEDPEGAVHYYLGFSQAGQGRLLIPTGGTELELKVDYGSNYESVRVRKGYSRLSGQQLEKEKKQASTYEKDMLSELSTFSAEEAFDAKNFLEKLYSKWSETAGFHDRAAVGRAMLVTLVLLRRAMLIKNETSDVRIHDGLVRPLHELSLQFFDQFDFATNRSLILENEWYAELLATTLELLVVKSIGDNTHSIRKAIQSLI